MTLLKYIQDFFIKIGSQLYNKALRPILSKVEGLLS